MIEVTRLRSVSFVLALLLGAIPLLPAEHVHETVGAGGQWELVAHNHATEHVPHLDVRESDSHATLEDEDTVILTVDPVFVPTVVYAVATPAAPQIRLLEEPQISERFRTPVHEPLAHGPPRAPSDLRGPPSLHL